MLFSHLDTPLVHVVGDDLRGQMEDARDPARNDHVWISLDAGVGQRITASISIWSIRNADAGFDPRVRLGVIREHWDVLPNRGVQGWNRFNYANWEAHHNVFYEYYERDVLGRLLLEMAAEARLLEIWGTPYRRRQEGLHQIHSRRASCAIANDIEGRDGALRFYFDKERETRMIFLKFCGQP